MTGSRCLNRSWCRIVLSIAAALLLVGIILAMGGHGALLLTSRVEDTSAAAVCETKAPDIERVNAHLQATQERMRETTVLLEKMEKQDKR